MTIGSRTQQKRCGIDGATGHYKCIGLDLGPFAVTLDLDARGPFACAVGQQAPYVGAGHKLDVAASKGRADAAEVGFGFGVHLAGKTVAGFTTDARPARSQVNTQRQKKWVQPLALQAVFKVFDVGLMRYRREWERLRTGWVRGVLSRLAVGQEHPFRAAVIGLKLLVLNSPGRGYSPFMLQFFKVLFPEPGQGRPVYLGVAAHKVVHPR